MKSLKLNADYEMQLFSGKKGTPLINQSLEFLLFFLEKSPVYSLKKYSAEYLDYVEEITTHRPELTTVDLAQNYWGALKNLEIERWWNSKLTSTQLIIDQNWCPDTRIIRSSSDFLNLDDQKQYLLKDPYGMSGQKFSVIGPQLSSSEKILILETFLKRGEFIIEPLLNRTFDFSHYVYPNGETIYYQNFIDKKFQYGGTYFHNWSKAQVEELAFYPLISREEWDQNIKRWDQIHTYYHQYPNELGYSVDSFAYEENGQIKIRPMAEVNYRRTMGRISFELAEKFAQKESQSLTVLVKNHNSPKPIWKILKESNKDWGRDVKIFALSPGDTRFDFIFISIQKNVDYKIILNELKKLLPDGDFSIQL